MPINIHTETRFSFTVDASIPMPVLGALNRAGLDPDKVAAHCESAIGANCNDRTRKASKSTKAVSVEWKPRKNDGGKLTVKVAGNTFELTDSPEGRFVEICNRIEALASMYVRIDDLKLPEAIVRHFKHEDLSVTAEAKPAATQVPA